MKISHLFFLSVAAATAVSCSNEGIDDQQQGTATGAKTLMSITAALRVDQPAPGTRAANPYEKNYNYVNQLNGNDEIGDLSVFIGSANALEGTGGVIYKNFLATQYTAAAATADGQRVFPKAETANAIEVLVANKQVNVMVNSNLTAAGPGLTQWLRDAGYAGGLTNRWFDTPYNLGQMDLTNTGTYLTEPKTAVSQVAKYEGGQDKILMTSEDFMSYPVNPEITAAQTVEAGAESGATAATGAASAKNRFVREVRRAAARVYVTTSKDVATDNFVIKNGETVLGTVSSLQYVVGQGEKRFYVGQKRVKATDGSRAANYSDSKDHEVRTPGYDYVATSTNYDQTAADSNAIKHYDYATLWSGAVSADRLTVNQLTDGVPVVQRGTAITSANPEESIDKLLSGTFFLPATHKSSAAVDGGAAAGTLGGSETGFKKGNTTYVLIRGKFTPAKFEDDDQFVYFSEPSTSAPYYTYKSEAEKVGPGKQTAGDAEGTFYRTSRGLYFRTLEGAIKSFGQVVSETEAAGVTSYVEGSGTAAAKFYTIPTSDYIERFPAGKMLWTLWVNPSTPLAENKFFAAPTVRNNIYTIHINGINSVGTNWNPLVPKPYKEKGGTGADKTDNVWTDYTNKFNPDPNPNVDPRVGGSVGTPNVPEDPTCTTCENDPPQPPFNPKDPKTPNDDPGSDLPTPKTYMSVESVVLPWQVHGYEVAL